jgi:hypothetical protein
VVTLLKFNNILTDGIILEKEEDNINRIIKLLRNQTKWLHDIPIEDIVEFLDTFGKYLEKNQKNVSFANGIQNLCEFLKKENLVRDLNVALRGNYKVLDEFVTLFDDSRFFYHSQPRGLAVHWIAGNVDVLGIFSIIQALITKNVSLVKVPHNYERLLNLINCIKNVSTSKISGNDVLKCISLVHIKHEDIENQQIISDSADIRIAWGGQEAIESILSLKKKFSTEDIIYGPKYSFCIIDKESLTNNTTEIAQKIALDVSVFDQYACNSPHTLLIEKPEDEMIIKNFAQELGKSLDVVNRIMIPKEPISQEKSMEIHSLRAEYEFKGEVISSEGTDWTVLYADEEGLANPCFSRVIFLRPINDILSVDSYINKKIQSIGLSILDEKQRKEILDKITLKGGDRCPSLGEMSVFHSPWDGMFSLDRMVRWITIPRKN